MAEGGGGGGLHGTTSSLLFSAGIFFATSLASQWLQIRMRQQQLVDDRKYDVGLFDDDDNDTDDKDEISINSFSEKNDGNSNNGDCVHEMRRLHANRRLSWGNRNFVVRQTSMFENEEVQETVSTNKNRTQEPAAAVGRERNSPHPLRNQQHKGSTKSIASIVSSNSVPVRDAAFDFRPKNSNWNHFERFNEKDVVNEMVNSLAETETEIEIDSIQDADIMSISPMSSSSDEQFVWTEARHRRHKKKKKKRTLRVSNTKNETAVPPLRRQLSTESTNFNSQTDISFVQNRVAARAQYNAQIMPSKVILVRHGQSMGNIDEKIYATTPDNAMPLTKLGWEQAILAGKQLKENILGGGDGDEKNNNIKNMTTKQRQQVHFIVSPYVRTVETFHAMASAWCDPKEFHMIENPDEKRKAWYGRLLELGLTWHEDPRIREQDFGNYQDPANIQKAKKDRHHFGAFYYRFADGESGSDVFDRVSIFLDSLWRSFDMNHTQNYVLVTHGIAIRVLLARYFRYTIHQFHTLANPRNCEMVTLGHDGFGKLQLEGRYDLEYVKQEENSSSVNVKQDNNSRSSSEQSQQQQQQQQNDNMSSVLHSEKNGATKKKSKQYVFHQRLRVLPQQYIKQVPIRIAYED